MATAFELANISNNVYELQSWNDWVIKTPEDLSNGFRAAVYEKEGEKERVVAFAGTDIFSWGDLANDLVILRGGIPDQAFNGLNYFAKVRDRRYFTTITGHSLGGAIADIVGHYNACFASTFNSPGTVGLTWNSGGQRQIEKDPRLDENIYHYLIKEDPCSYGNHLGLENWSWADPSIIAHFMSQWLDKKRYDYYGNYAPNNPMNKQLIKKVEPYNDF